MSRVHGTVVALNGQGILLRGASGSGKSDLALRLIAEGAELVADDQVELNPEAGILFASPPATIEGLIEVRGIGIRRLPFRSRVPLVLVVDLTSEAVERMPEKSHTILGGIEIASMPLIGFEASAAAKVAQALRPEVDMRAAGAAAHVGYRENTMIEPSPSLRIPDATDVPPKARVVLITGMSGAGRSTTLKLLEDMGYEAVDNLPLSLLPRLVGSGDQKPHPIAVGIDIRTRDFGVNSVCGELEKLIAHRGLDCRLVFLECDDDVLARRYTETRRRHPLAGDRPVIDGIRLERTLVTPLRDRADLVIDTSVSRTADLKRLLAGNFGLRHAGGLRLFVTSFSFREGLPRDADLVFDVRFLENPYYEPHLRFLTGLDPAVAAFIAADSSWERFFGTLTTLLETLLPRYDREGKSYLTIAFGCTGGRHRSVYAAERLAQWLGTDHPGVSVAHRDIERPMNSNFGDPKRLAPVAG